MTMDNKVFEEPKRQKVMQELSQLKIGAPLLKEVHLVKVAKDEEVKEQIEETSSSEYDSEEERLRE